MSRPDPQLFLDRVERKVEALVGFETSEGLSDHQLRRGVLSTLEQGLPLRDAIVIREARRWAEADTPRARAAWESALRGLAQVLPAPTFQLWIRPIELVGEASGLLQLAAPTGIRSWVERRYMPLIDEAVRIESDFPGAIFVAITLPDLAPRLAR